MENVGTSISFVWIIGKERVFCGVMVAVPQRSFLWNSIKSWEYSNLIFCGPLFALKLELFFFKRIGFTFFLLLLFVSIAHVIVSWYHAKDLCLGEKHSFTSLYKRTLVFSSHCSIWNKPWFLVCAGSLQFPCVTILTEKQLRCLQTGFISLGYYLKPKWLSVSVKEREVIEFNL